MKLIGKIFRILLYLVILAVLFVACRFAVLLLGWEARWTTIVFLAIAGGYFLLGRLLYRFRRYREERRAVKLLEADKQSQEASGADPQLAAHMHMTWKSGLDFLGKSRLGRFSTVYALPWYLTLNLSGDREKSGRIIQAAGVHGASPEELVANPDFNWVFAEKAVWLDLDFAFKPDADTYWPLFMRELVSNRGKAPLGGIAIILDAAEMLDKSDADIKELAAEIRNRLDVIIKVTGTRVPVYVFVNRIDRLYGLRSLARTLPAETLDRPFGAFRTDESEIPGDFALRVLSFSADAIGYTSRESMHASRAPADTQGNARFPKGEAAAVQGPEELLRLEAPLSLFCREAFSDNPYHMIPFLRGLFFGSSGPEGDVIPPRVSDFTSLRFEHENPEPARPWFWKNLIADQIPSDPAPYRAVRRRRHARAVTLHAGLAALMVCTLAICWLLTHIYRENRDVLRLMAGKTDTPARAEELKPYLNNILFVNNERLSSWHPRMGMHEVDTLAGEMKKRYCDAFLRHWIMPEMEEVDRRVRSIASERDPGAIGRMMLSLAVLKHAAKGYGNDQLMDVLFQNLHEGGSDIRAMTRAYMQWSVPDTSGVVNEELVERERYIIDSAMGGDVMNWLPQWVESLSSLASVSLSSVCSPLVLSADTIGKRDISAAWTGQGYAMAAALLDSLARDDQTENKIWTARRDRLLEKYRQTALKSWAGVTVNLWNDMRDSMDDSALPTLILHASQADDPAMRTIKLMHRHLLPMFDKDETNPDVRWLRTYGQLIDIIRPMLKLEGGGDEEPGLIEKVKGTVTGVARRIGSQAGAELIARNIGLTPGGDLASSLDGLQRLMRAFGVVNTISLSRDQCMDMVRRQFILATHPNISPASLGPEQAGGAEQGEGRAVTKDPFGDAKSAAQKLESALYEVNGSGMWAHLGPMASYHYMRFLLVRLAAGYVDGMWFSTVYNPAQLSTGTNEENRAKLIGQGGLIDTFMSGPAKGLWRRENRRLANAVWDDIVFRFSPEFLSYCDAVVQMSRSKQPEKISLGFRVDAVSVNKNAKERPHTVTFSLREESFEDQSLIYQNYNVATAFEWNLNPGAEMLVRLEFPSITLEKTFAGNRALGEFIKTFNMGSLILTPEDFPESADALKRLGISGVSIRVTMRNQAALLKYLYESVPELPSSAVIHSSGEKQGRQEENPNLPTLESFMDGEGDNGGNTER